MAKKTTSTNTQVTDLIALLVAIFYMQSVLTVAHHTSMWVHDGSTHIVQAPAVPALIIGLLLCAYSWYKKKSTPSLIVVIDLTILATASLFWLSGLRTNFYF